MTRMSHIKIGVIPAAGKGKRMGYLSHLVPKCLFPVYDRPIIHSVIENMRNVGVEQVYIIVHYQQDKLKEYLLSANDELGVSVTFIEQHELSGIAQAVLLVREAVNEPFMTILGDDCSITPSLANLVDIFFDTGAIVVEGIVAEESLEALRSACCVSLAKDKRITDIVEKPNNPSTKLRGCGVYVFDTTIFDYIRQTPVSVIRNEVEITHTIAMLAKQGKAYGGFINGVNININSCDDLLHASQLARNLRAKSAFSDSTPIGTARTVDALQFPERNVAGQ